MTITDGINIIKNAHEHMSDAPGVYKMIDNNEKIIYVGKARSLAKRVINYTRPERLEYRIQSMISNVAKVETVTTKSEAEALLLEANLIKKHEPRYNILLKDDKSFPYILITEDHEFPRICKHRGARKIKGKYFGPFASAGSVNKSIADLQKAFLIRPCSDSFFAARQRPCMEYQIKRCSAPCVDKISRDDYACLVDQTKEFLSGKSRNIQQELANQMAKQSAQFNYEKAAIYRDRIKALNHIQAGQNINLATLDDVDVIGVYQSSGHACIQVFFFRGGQNYGNRSFFPKYNGDSSAGEILEAFVGQFYNDDNIPPKQILISDNIGDKALLEDSLTQLCHYKVTITSPQKGEKKKLIEDAVRNAKNTLQQKSLSNAKQEKLLKSVQDLFTLPELPSRIEVYDNSHISGKFEVGAMIVAGRDGFNKKAYRRFNMREKGFVPGDDYAMTEQVLMRRFKRLKMETPQKTAGIWPDLVLIDGGAGHLTIAEKVFDELGLTGQITFVCISKGPDRNAGREQFHMSGRDSFTLPMTDPAMYYLQVLRDEAHRFAIGSHRKKRAKSVSKSAFDEIPGIGPKRKKILLNHFGSVDDVKNASVAELQKAAGIDRKIAEEIYRFFH